MTGESVKACVLSSQIIPRADQSLLRRLGAKASECSLGIITSDCDDLSYVAVDESTKKANVRVVYTKSMYAGADNATTNLAGEWIGIIAGENPDDVKYGLEVAKSYIENERGFVKANEDGSIVCFAHCISSIGTYFSKIAKIPVGSSLAYLIAPPSEAICALDAALKSADVKIKVFYGPPTETNFAGGLLTGEQAACEAACDSFYTEVKKVADRPLSV
ncbi:ethanolamine utilization protein EutL [Dethiosulfatibacter aminovorans DSM 17477]|uniref:Ethanolamine utilization protein EutL n=1 Tax=Dethiosulfatibacter aminovorans DSM 17477 TaxID=1121476 RepID=A0A1M6DRA0_9FIRM|nr:ethanolamine utilization microcompartment protein EutL [Dethiosulfatibacter aminovorans]SHI75508.1 ethanolamine utilization protein EutL [Dethiosulfatibacter aminovorans DSM 17477]